MDSDLNKVIVEESAKEAQENTAVEAKDPSEDIPPENSGIGSISFVSCATGDEAMEPSSLVSEPEEGKSTTSIQSLHHWTCFVFYLRFVLFFSRIKTSADKRNSYRTGYVMFFCFVFPPNFSVYLLCCYTNPAEGRSPLNRRLDVYKLESEPPLETLPFISHTTNNISRDFRAGDSELFWIFILHYFSHGQRR